MTDRVTLLALAERCEKATGHERTLEEDIAKARGWVPIPNPTNAGGLVGRWTMPDGQMSGMEGPPPFTASLDAAMTLAGDNEAFWLLHEAVERLRIHLLPADPYPTNEAQRGYLARYFTAAALRAQAAMIGEPS